jgi:PleD family two-component response regulator
MILAVVSDLMFTSKIRTAAARIGVDVVFARSSRDALAVMEKGPPALVILDLDSQSTDPLGTVSAMKADPALTTVPTVGFVSHVHANLIDAARKAGVDDVMARSAFAERLPAILERDRARS